MQADSRSKSQAFDQRSESVVRLEVMSEGLLQGITKVFHQRAANELLRVVFYGSGCSRDSSANIVIKVLNLVTVPACFS